MKRAHWLSKNTWRASLAAVTLATLLAAVPPSQDEAATDEFQAGLAEIQLEDIRVHVNLLAAPSFEGRDTPSQGLSLAALYLAQHMQDLGIDPAKDSQKVFKKAKSAYRPWLPEDAGKREDGKSRSKKSGTYLRPWTKPFIAPVPKKCLLKLDTPAKDFKYGEDFVPIQGASGKARGELVFCGYGIRSSKEDYDDLAGLSLSGKIALIFEGEPEGSGLFEGTRVSDAASLWSKTELLMKKKVSGILVVRAGSGAEEGEEGEVEDGLGPAYRFTQAMFLGDRRQDFPPRKIPPMLVISEACASELLGQDARALRESIDEAGAPQPIELEGRKLFFKVETELMYAAIDNVVGILRGSDSKLANEYVVVGAHYDHIGVGPRGRVGLGADDNASGTSALLEIMQALTVSKPRRSILFAFFSGEEDGLLGSKELCENLPIDKKRIAAMINLDMIGRGPADKVVVLGLKQNPALKEVVDRANTFSETGIREIEVCKDDSLFQRSDHYSFHQKLGSPTVFFLENYPVEKNSDYHTWRDTVDRLSFDKITNTAKLAYGTIWLIANDDKRPPKPK